MNKKILLHIVCFFLLLCPAAVQADGAVTLSEYSRNIHSELPDVLYAGLTIEDESFRLRLMSAPVLSRSTHQMVADLDMKYLLIRLEITNKGGETVSWLKHESFTVQDTYLGRVYGTFKLDIAASAKTSNTAALDVFYSKIEPGKTLQTVLVFEVYPDVESFIFTFSPQTFYGGSLGSSIQFRLPRALVQ